MRRTLLLCLSIITFGCASCGPSGDGQPQTPQVPDNGNGGSGGTEGGTNENMKIRLTIDGKVFTGTLEDNAAAAAFRELLPITAEMAELNRNEKYYYLSQDLPISASRPGTIRSGDIMLYGSNCVVLFYKTFSTTYSYTRLGSLDDSSDLEMTVGPASVTVKFEIIGSNENE